MTILAKWDKKKTCPLSAKAEPFSLSVASRGQLISGERGVRMAQTIPLKCRHCVYFSKAHDYSAGMYGIFETSGRWDFSTCDRTCYRETKTRSERKQGERYKGHINRNDWGYRNGVTV